MRKAAFIAAAMVVLLFAGWVQAEICFIVNGSFEDDGDYISDITETEPNGWDVNLPSNFHGRVDEDWSTDCNYSLTLESYSYATFEANDTATVSQEVCLTDVNEIIFDVSLVTTLDKPWDPNKRSAVLLIDGDVVWKSNSVGSDVRGEYYNRTYTVNEIYKDTSLHKLSLGLRVNVAEDSYIQYRAKWDFVGFYDLPCRGCGLLAGDFDRDCYVDMKDLKMFTDVWLDEVDPNDKYNLFQGGIINFCDFAIYANSWDGNMPDLKMFTDVWLAEVDPNNKYNLFDVESIGFINFLDFAIFADNWLKTSCEQGE